jgi:hypothetical protein
MPYFDEPGLRFDMGPHVRFDDPRTLQEILNPTPTPMIEVVLDIRKLSPADLATKARAIKVALTGNPKFTGLDTALASLATETGTLDTDQAEVLLRKSKVTEAVSKRDDSQGAVIDRLNAIAVEVGKQAQTEEDVLTAGMRGKKQPTPTAIPGQVTGLSATTSDTEKALDAHCNSQDDADYFEYETTTDPAGETGWALKGTSKISQWTVTDLTSGTKTWIRARGVNSKGRGPWSSPVCRRVA